MDKSYIIRIYSQENEHASGIVEDKGWKNGY